MRTESSRGVPESQEMEGPLKIVDNLTVRVIRDFCHFEHPPAPVRSDIPGPPRPLAELLQGHSRPLVGRADVNWGLAMMSDLPVAGSVAEDRADMPAKRRRPAAHGLGGRVMAVEPIGQIWIIHNRMMNPRGQGLPAVVIPRVWMMFPEWTGAPSGVLVFANCWFISPRF